MNGLRVAVVTGSASGIGRATALRLRSEGWTVAGIDKNESDAPERLCFQASTADPVELSGLVDRIASVAGRIDAIVSCAGVNEHTPFVSLNDLDWSEMWSVHAGAAATLIDSGSPYLVESAGSIVLVGSELEFIGGKDNAHYVTSKGALTGLVAAFAGTLGGQGVSLHMVAPGPTSTAMLEGSTQSGIGEELPLGRAASADEIARMIVFLIDHYAGGYSLRLVPSCGAVLC